MDSAQKIWEKAKKIARDKKYIRSTLIKAGGKLEGLSGNSSELKDLKSRLEVLLKMVRAHLSGEYRTFPASTIILLVFALLYFIIPTDLIPDFIPALGFTDDASVVLLVMRKLSQDINRFEEWENDQWEEVKSQEDT